MNYGIKIKMLRERKGITQKELADYLGIDPKLYSHYETEDRIIPCKHLIGVSNYFGVSIDFLLDFCELNTHIQHKRIEINKEKSGKRLKEFRKENKITQNKLATFLNTTHSVISDYERGRNLIATPFLYQICKKYNISADYLLGKNDHPKYLK